MSCFGRKIDVPRDRRRKPRQAVCLSGSVTFLDGSKSVLVENLCPAGARVLGRRLPAAGKEIIIRAGEFEAFGRIAWANHDYRGVSFEAPLE